MRPGKDATILALALMVPRALAAAEKLKSEHGIDCEVVDVRSLVPLDTQTILGSVARTHRLFTVEENPRLCGWGAELVSIVADEAFYDLDGPPVRITTPHIPLPAADILEDLALPSVDRIAETRATQPSRMTGGRSWQRTEPRKSERTDRHRSYLRERSGAGVGHARPRRAARRRGTTTRWTTSSSTSPAARSRLRTSMAVPSSPNDKVGGVIWQDAGEKHELRNLTDEPYRNILVELKPRKITP